MITQLVKPSAEPVSLDAMKNYLRVDHNEEDALIALLIVAARRSAEHLTGQMIAKRSFRVDLPSFGKGVLPISPVISVTSVEYLDSVGKKSLTVDFFPYPLSPQIFPPASGWPALKCRPDAVQVTLIAGMDPVPEDIAAWIMLRVSTAYEKREAVDEKSVNPLPRSFVDGLLDPYCVVTV